MINKNKYAVVIQGEDPQIESDNKQDEHKHIETKNNGVTREPHEPLEPPFPERLLVKKVEVPVEYDLDSELSNFCIKIPLLQAIKDIPIYTKIIRDIFINKNRMEKSNNQTIKLVSLENASKNPNLLFSLN